MTADQLYQLVNALQQSWAIQDAICKPNGVFAASYNEHLAYGLHAALTSKDVKVLTDAELSDKWCSESSDEKDAMIEDLEVRIEILQTSNDYFKNQALLGGKIIKSLKSNIAKAIEPVTAELLEISDKVTTV